MAIILKQSKAAYTFASSWSVTLDHPVAANDIIVLGISYASNPTPTASGLTWNLEYSHNNPAYIYDYQSVYWALVTSPGTPTINFSGVGGSIALIVNILVFSGLNTSSPLDGSEVMANGTLGAYATVTATSGSLTPVHDGDAIVGFCTVNEGYAAFAEVAGSGIACSAASTGPNSMACAYHFVSGTSATTVALLATNSSPSLEHWLIGALLLKGAAAQPVERGGIDYDQIRVLARSGDGDHFLMTKSSLTPGNLLVSDAAGNAIDGGAVPSPGGAGTVTHTAGALTANLPVLGAGAADVKIGTAAQLVPTLPADATKYLDGTGAFSVPAGGGGGGGSWWPLSTLLAPDNTSFSDWNAPTRVSQVGGAVVLACDYSATFQARGRVKSAPVGAYTLEGAIVPDVYPGNYTACGVGIRDSGTGKVLLLSLIYNGGWKISVDYWADDHGASGATRASIDGQFYTSARPLFFTIQDNATNHIFKVGMSLTEMKTVRTQGRTADLANPNQLLCWALSNNSSWATVVNHLVHWKEF